MEPRRLAHPVMPTFRWAALLGFALVAPISLPAGGADRRQPEIRRRAPGDPLVFGDRAELKVAPCHQAPVLQRVVGDQHAQLIRTWQDGRGTRWLMLESGDGLGGRRRGWLRLDTLG